MKKLKRLFIFILVNLLSTGLFAYEINDTQQVPAGHWIYDAMYTINADARIVNALETAPMSIGELKFYFNQINYDDLSDFSKELYEDVKNYLYQPRTFYNKDALVLNFNLGVNPEFYYKTGTTNDINDPEYIDWTFDYYYKDNLLTLPMYIGFSNYFSIEMDMFIGKNFGAANSPNAFTNIPLGLEVNDFEFLWPRYAYGSTGLFFDNWGVSFHLGKEGLTIGNTQLRSIIYDKSFETDSYSQLSLYTKWFKYSLDVAQVQAEKFLYLHEITFRPFRNFTFTAVEGSQLNGSFQLRYLNPLMIMHSYSSWIENMTNNESAYYYENNFCAYLAFSFDYVPIKNLRLYGLFAQNEIQAFGERSGDGCYTPDSIGLQLGAEYTLPVSKEDFWKFNFEAVYTSPWLYIKPSRESSLIRERKDNLNGRYLNGNGVVTTWIGSPYGPDSFVLDFKVEYAKRKKYSFTFDYEFSIHGENGLSTLYDSNNWNDNLKIFTYYPFVKHILLKKGAQMDYTTNPNGDDVGNVLQYGTQDEALESATNMWMSGDPAYLHKFTLGAEYYFTKNLSINSQFVYNLLMVTAGGNTGFAHGFEADFALTYRLFD
jgi:hypothetical protein